MPFDAATLQTLYPRRGVYASKLVRATTRSLLAGYIDRHDAAATIREALR